MFALVTDLDLVLLHVGLHEHGLVAGDHHHALGSVLGVTVPDTGGGYRLVTVTDRVIDRVID